MMEMIPSSLAEYGAPTASGTLRRKRTGLVGYRNPTARVHMIANLGGDDQQNLFTTKSSARPCCFGWPRLLAFQKQNCNSRGALPTQVRTTRQVIARCYKRSFHGRISREGFKRPSSSLTVIEFYDLLSVCCFRAPSLGSSYPPCDSNTPRSARVPHRSGPLRQSRASAARAKLEPSADLGSARANRHR
jgi:hypothetical protein